MAKVSELFFCVVFSSCGKDKFTSAPQITFKSISSSYVYNSPQGTPPALLTLELTDALLVRRTYDSSFALAERMLRFVYEQRRKQRMEEAQKASQDQANFAAQAGVQVEQEKQKSIQAQLEFDRQKEKSKSETEQINIMLKGSFDLINTAFTAGREIPEMYSSIVQLAVQSAGAKTQLSLQQTEQEAEMINQQQEQEMASQEIQQALQAGEITEEEAMQMMQEAGIQQEQQP